MRCWKNLEELMKEIISRDSGGAAAGTGQRDSGTGAYIQRIQSYRRYDGSYGRTMEEVRIK